MLLRAKGISHNLNSRIVGKVTRSTLNLDGSEILIVKNNTINDDENFSAKALLSESLDPLNSNLPYINNVPTLDHLEEGDIVEIVTSGLVNTLYRTSSDHNTLLFTERCNSNCLMCSQPPKKKDDFEYYFNLYSDLIPLLPENCRCIGITGGEPTLMKEYFWILLDKLFKQLPNTEIQVLTNGRAFAWPEYVNELSKIRNDKLILCIPLYSDYYQLHDYIVQAKNAFYQTVNGLYNLAEVEQRIELRIVLHKLTIPRLYSLAKYIYKNLPFVEHVAFMGLENMGYTPHNLHLLWIDPKDYMNELENAVLYLDKARMNVSIYNLQHCITPNSIWKFLRKSISDWKNIYLTECEICDIKKDCAGFFLSNKYVHSKFVYPIKIS